MVATDTVRIGEVLLEMLLVHTALSPADTGQDELSVDSCRLILRAYGIRLNGIEIGDRQEQSSGGHRRCSGQFFIDFEKESDGNTMRIRSNGTFEGVVHTSGAIRVEYRGDTFKFVSEIANTDWDIGNFFHASFSSVFQYV